MSLRTVAAPLLCLCLAAACGSSAAPARPAAPAPAAATPPAKGASSAAQKLQHVTFVFDFIPGATDAPFYATQALGYFKDEGLDVTLQPGKDPATATQLVVNGQADIGKDSPPDVAIAISKGAPILSVAGTVEGDPFGIIYPNNKPLSKPSDVYGKTIGVPAGTEAATLWKAFVEANHLDLSRIQVVNTSLATQAGLLARGQLDAISGSAVSLMPALGSIGVNVSTLYYSDFGVHTMSEDIIATNAYAKQHPDIVRKFLAALARGWAYAQQHPDLAGEDFIRSSPQAGKQNPALVSKGVAFQLKFLHSQATTGKPWGYQAPSDWQNELQFVKQYGGVKTNLPASAFFTNAYVPQS